MEPPSAEYPLGTDRVGRDLLATMIAGTPLTLRIGFLAGLLGVGLATLLAFVAAFYGGLIDTVIQTVVDIGLTIPSLLILIIIAVSIQGPISVNQMALVVASTAWLWPTRVIRSEVLSLKQRAYVELARVSGMSGLEIIVKELIPNLLPYIMASLVGSVSSAILASVGLEALGLGPIDSPTLGMTIYWVILYAAVIQGWWWWWIPPIVILLLVFVGLFLISIGMDELANPRLRTSA
ncbi:ABC transporter permease [Candidatus Entotheonella palauensis]|uniref:ABC transporter permease n=1 Tax=Candidatus Entotheonella palauensis TaxID=93172 RepID=UPI0021177079|nr:ABC transporter permease [Candidatus Entotheonella palauensis]